jgi:methionine-R-sulfoxide reductase
MDAKIPPPPPAMIRPRQDTSDQKTPLQQKNQSKLFKPSVAQAPKNQWRNFKKPTLPELEKKLTPAQLQITQNEGTERPFQNEYWNHHEAGIYVDVVSGEPLFSSLDKYDSGSGWPSFTRPIDEALIATREDQKLGTVRTEIRSKMGDSHLGHVFDDGPKEKGGLRFCVNSGALRFVPLEEMRDQGYGEYLKLFESVSGGTKK